MNPDFQEDQPKEEFPQHLCNMCGKCCRSITTAFTHEELEELAKAGEEDAKVFVDIFKRYSTVEDARKAVPEQIEQVLNTIRERGGDITKVSFYYCPHVTENNLCSIYKDRPDCCKRFPRNGWSIFSPLCGFTGWQFEQREKHKKMIRSLKEYLHMYEAISEDGKIPGKDMTIEEFKKLIEEKIKPWERFGANFW